MNAQPDLRAAWDYGEVPTISSLIAAAEDYFQGGRRFPKRIEMTSALWDEVRERFGGPEKPLNTTQFIGGPWKLVGIPIVVDDAVPPPGWRVIDVRGAVPSEEQGEPQ